MADAASTAHNPLRIECTEPILRVHSIAASVRFYESILGFQNAPWGDADFTSVGRDGHGIYLCRDGQGRGGAWVWIGVNDIEDLHQHCKTLGVKILIPPTKFPWAYEMQIEDPDGNVLRLGTDPK
jgi:predicted enzyme related to lactoylglutathione lyase